MPFRPWLVATVVLFASIMTFAGVAGASSNAAGSSDGLQAIFMEVDGKVRWRQHESDPWRNAAVNDLVDPGAEIRTGLRSRATLRVGKNASILVDAGTSFQLPTVVREGDTLRTLAAVPRLCGRPSWQSFAPGSAG